MLLNELFEGSPDIEIKQLDIDRYLVIAKKKGWVLDITATTIVMKPLKMELM